MEREKVLRLAQQTLLNDDSHEVREAFVYLTEERHIPVKYLEIFEMGYVPKRVINLNGDTHEFAGRIVMPIRDQYGTMVALSSRDWRKNAYQKFLHEQFCKLDYLYALNIAKNSILKKKQSILVEGELDVVQMHVHGIGCTVGVLGSALGLKQISLLSRYCDEIFLLFDGDDAGKKALDKAMQLGYDYKLAENCGVRLIPVILPDEMDPDEFLRQEGRNKLISLLKESKAKTENRGDII